MQRAIASLALGTVLAAAALPARALPRPEISFSIDDGPWIRRPNVSPLLGRRVRLRVEPVPGAEIRWYQIVPDVGAMYKNANHPWEPKAYQWVGLAKIASQRREMTKFRGRWEFELFQAGRRAEPGDWGDDSASSFLASPYHHPDAGSFWFQVEVEKDGAVAASPGLAESDASGLSPGVFRVSVRDGPGYLGFVSSFFNVPALFGSLPRQSNNFIGADCADLLVAARGQWTGKVPQTNYNVAMLVRGEKKVAELDFGAGKASRELRWGETVAPGDWVAVRYAGARQYQHIGVLARDDGDGVLDGDDAVLHAGPWPLAPARLGDGPFDGRLAILRPAPPVVDRPIAFSAARKEATRDYIRVHYGRESSEITIEPKMIVLHWTGTASLEASWRTFDAETLPEGRGDIAAGGKLNVSAHFLVGRDGTIYRLMPETWMARHVIGLNLHAIGIENVGGEGGADDLSPAQLEANAWLVRRLKDDFPGIRHLIGHHEYLRFEGDPLWSEKLPGYRTRKSDPGDRFMSRVRERVAELGLEP